MKKRKIWRMKFFFIPTIAIGLVVVLFPWLTFKEHPIFTVLYVYIGVMLFLLLLRSKDSWPLETGKTFDQVITILIWCVSLPVFLLLGLMAILIVLCYRRSIYVVGYLLSITIIFVFGIRLKIIGERPKEQFIAIINHCSTIDDLIDAIIMGFNPWKVVYAPEVVRIPFVKYFANHIGIPVSRTEVVSRKAAAEKMKQELKHGFNVLIFPEGRRLIVSDNKEEQQYLLDFKNGPFLLSEATGVPILPVVISWTFLFKPRSGQWWFSPQTITVFYLDPVTKNETESLEDFKKRIWDAMYLTLIESIEEN